MMSLPEKGKHFSARRPDILYAVRNLLTGNDFHIQK